MLPLGVSHIETNEDGKEVMHWGYGMTECWCGRINLHLRGKPLIACLGVHLNPEQKGD